MAVSRPLVIALLLSVLAAAAFLATRGSTEITSTPPPPAAAPEKPLKSISPGGDGGSSKAPSGKYDSAHAPGRDSSKPDANHAPAKPKPSSKPKLATVTGVPPRVGRALAEKRVVVVLFRQRGDDSATAKAVAGVRGKGVSVFTDSIDDLGRYPRLVAGLGISQAPSVVVVGPSRKAVLLEGYTDEGTIDQTVLDSR